MVLPRIEPPMPPQAAVSRQAVTIVVAFNIIAPSLLMLQTPAARASTSHGVRAHPRQTMYPSAARASGLPAPARHQDGG
jgi:hypothetical protein